MKFLIAICIILWACAYTTMSRTLSESSVVELHQQWMTKYGRTYTNSFELEKRKKIFQENLEYIENFNNAGNTSYKLGLNPFSDLTSEEFIATHTGLKVSSQVSSSKMESLVVPFNLNDDVPTNFDWRQQGVATNVKNQGSICGCCWAFTTVATVEGIVKIKTGNSISLSEQQLLDCDEQSSGCDGGNFHNAFDSIIQTKGIVREEDYPYEQQKQTCRLNGQIAAAQITSYATVTSNDEQQLLQAVAQQPVATRIKVNDEFILYQSGIYSGSCAPSFNHEVTIIGYGVNAEGMKYWLIKNSWGESWGENGYMRLIREKSGEPGGQCGMAESAGYPII